MPRITRSNKAYDTPKTFNRTKSTIQSVQQHSSPSDSINSLSNSNNSSLVIASDNIEGFLKYIRLEKYIHQFKINDISVEQLKSLNDHQYKELGVTIGDRIRIQEAIIQYQPILNSTTIDQSISLQIQSLSLSLNKWIRSKPRFAVVYWNIYDRVMRGLPRTTNHVEGWHRKMGYDGFKNTSVIRFLDQIQKEQSTTENNITRNLSGELIGVKSRKVIEKNNKLQSIVSQYDKKDINGYINRISLALIPDK